MKYLLIFPSYLVSVVHLQQGEKHPVLGQQSLSGAEFRQAVRESILLPRLLRGLDREHGCVEVSDGLDVPPELRQGATVVSSC